MRFKTTPSLRLALLLSGFAAAPLHAQFEYVSSGGTFRTDAVNLASGATAIGQDEYGVPHFIANINDGLYGNAHSWLGGNQGDVYFESDSNSWVGVSFAAPQTIASFAFGRDNTGVFGDRAGGPYLIQVDQGGGFTSVGVLHYGSNITVDTAAVRNLFNLTTPLTGVLQFRIAATAEAYRYSGNDEESGDPIFGFFVTGQAIDELELYSTPATAIPEPSAFAALAGMGSLGLAALRRRRRA